eukprot:GFUD01034812.1.p1 GENE.GFUD01034812.1~~GFUD01034812.1.p1  ORF type:complete len:313 (-),score=94.70 GFUD01034812.1:83-1021(-)
MKRILVTGANKGIGLAIVTKLLQDYPDTYLLLGSRDVGRGQAALQTVVAELGEDSKERLELVEIDVTSDESVKNAVEAVKAKHGESEPLYGLVNNAGGSLDTPRGTVDLNMYGLRRVCEAFLPLIQKDKGRIVQISSGAAPMFVAKCSQKNQAFLVNKIVTWTDIEETIITPFLNISQDESLDAEKKSAALAVVGLSEGGMGAYGMSKACVNAYTLHLARRFPTLLINSCSPGFIETDLTRPWAKQSGKKPEEMGMLPVEMGTVAANYLMMGDLEGEIEGYESGRYYGSDGKWSPFHKYRSPGDPAYDGTFP